MKKLLIVFISVLILGILGCTDAQMGKIKAVGNAAHVQCYSGELLIYDGVSTGKISSEQNSDGYYFVDAKTGKVMEVSGNCIITYSK